MKFKIKFNLIFLALLFFINPSWAKNSLPDIETYKYTNNARKKIASSLSSWAKIQLDKLNEEAVIISRSGSTITRIFDKTNLGHSGIVIKDPEYKTWMVYSLFSNPDTKHRYFYIKRTSLYDFFYNQPDFQKRCILFIPKKDLQPNLRQILISGNYNKIIGDKTKYNLISSSENTESVNCVEWIFLNLYAAKLNTFDAKIIIKTINKENDIKPIRLPLIMKPFLKMYPNVFIEELPKDRKVKTLMVQDLYKNNLIQKKITY